MNHEHYKHLLLRVVDGVATDKERDEFESHIKSCNECSKEFGELKNLEEFMSAVKLRDLTEEARASFWRSVYNRLERRLGWLFAGLGVLLLFGFGIFLFIKEFVLNPSVSIFFKIGVSAVLLGLLGLFISVLREKLFLRRYDKYSKEVKL